jgi:hypothetical protein
MPIVRSGSDVARIFSMSTGDATRCDARGVGPGNVVGGAAVVAGAAAVVVGATVVGVLVAPMVVVGGVVAPITVDVTANVLTETPATIAATLVNRRARALRPDIGCSG